MNKTLLLLAAAMLPALCGAQNALEYEGERIALETHFFQSSQLGKLQGKGKLSYQGMDVWGNHMLSLQHTGLATIYQLSDGGIKKLKQFKLASNGDGNHANTVSFGPSLAAQGDPMPPIYVSHCSKASTACSVERITPDLKGSTLVQTITLEGNSNPLQWVVDRDNNCLVAIMSTAGWDKAGNHRIMRFALPDLSQEQVALTQADAIESYLIEDTYKAPFAVVMQGAAVHNSLLFLPTGSGTAKQPSALYVWDLATRSMRNVVDLSGATSGEPEDCAVWNSRLLLQTQGQVYNIAF